MNDVNKFYYYLSLNDYERVNWLKLMEVAAKNKRMTLGYLESIWEIEYERMEKILLFYD